MTERGRGLYGDAEAAGRVLAALGGTPVAPARPANEAPPVYRGRCGNRAHHNDHGCENETAPPPNPLRLCAECLAKYASLAMVSVGFEPAKTSYILIPTHPCVPLDDNTIARIEQNKNLILDPNACGLVDSTGMAVCAERRVFMRCDCKRHPDRPTRGHENCDKCRAVGYVIVERIPTGCGAKFALDRHGLRIKV